MFMSDRRLGADFLVKLILVLDIILKA